jgi:DNA-binding CsgD family transcriptional regulator
MESRERDFDERDRLLVEALAPHFVALDRQAAVRRRLAAALSELASADADEPHGIILLGRDGRVEHASPAARRIVGAWFGELDGRLPSLLEEWRAGAAAPAPLELDRDGRRLVVEAPNGDALLVREDATAVRLLTRRERDVLRCIAAGLTTAETARRLWVTPATISKHLEHTYAKLGVRSRTAALAALGLRVPGRAENGAAER